MCCEPLQCQEEKPNIIALGECESIRKIRKLKEESGTRKHNIRNWKLAAINRTQREWVITDC